MYCQYGMNILDQKIQKVETLYSYNSTHSLLVSVIIFYVNAM